MTILALNFKKASFFLLFKLLLAAGIALERMTANPVARNLGLKWIKKVFSVPISLDSSCS